MSTEKYKNFIIVTAAQNNDGNLRHYAIVKSGNYTCLFHDFMVEGQVIGFTESYEEAVKLFNQSIAEHNVEESR